MITAKEKRIDAFGMLKNAPLFEKEVHEEFW